MVYYDDWFISSPVSVFTAIINIYTPEGSSLRPTGDMEADAQSVEIRMQ